MSHSGCTHITWSLSARFQPVPVTAFTVPELLSYLSLVRMHIYALLQIINGLSLPVSIRQMRFLMQASQFTHTHIRYCSSDCLHGSCTFVLFLFDTYVFLYGNNKWLVITGLDARHYVTVSFRMKALAQPYLFFFFSSHFFKLSYNLLSIVHKFSSTKFRLFLKTPQRNVINRLTIGTSGSMSSFHGNDYYIRNIIRHCNISSTSFIPKVLHHLMVPLSPSRWDNASGSGQTPSVRHLFSSCLCHTTTIHNTNRRQIHEHDVAVII